MICGHCMDSLMLLIVTGRQYKSGLFIGLTWEKLILAAGCWPNTISRCLQAVRRQLGTLAVTQLGSAFVQFNLDCCKLQRCQTIPISLMSNWSWTYETRPRRAYQISTPAIELHRLPIMQTESRLQTVHINKLTDYIYPPLPVIQHVLVHEHN